MIRAAILLCSLIQDRENIKRGPKSPKRSPRGPGDPKGDPLWNSASGDQNNIEKASKYILFAIKTQKPSPLEALGGTSVLLVTFLYWVESVTGRWEYYLPGIIVQGPMC